MANDDLDFSIIPGKKVYSSAPTMGGDDVEFDIGKRPPPEKQAQEATTQVRHPEQKPNMDWTEVGQKALENAPQSAVEFGKSIAHPFMHPQEAYEGLKSIGTGLYSKAAGALGANQNAEKKAQDEAGVNAIGRFYADRYGSMDGFKNALANDPVGVLADAASVLTLGGGTAAKAPGLIGTAGKTVAKVGNAIDPLNAVAQTAKVGTKAVAGALSLPEWWTTGASLSSLNNAAKAGLENNKEFVRHLTGAARPEEAVDRIEAVHSKLAQQRSAELVQGMGEIANIPMKYEPVQAAVDNVMPRFFDKGTIRDAEGVAAMKRVQDLIDDYRTNPNFTANVQTMQNLKTDLRKIGQDYRLGTDIRSAIDSVSNSVRNEIGALPNGVGKKYNEIMDAYGRQSEELNNIRKSFLTGTYDGPKIRKILSAKDDKFKGNILEQIAKVDPDIPYVVAGLELHPLMPSGLRGQLSGLLAGGYMGTMLGAPHALASMAAHSPRVIGGVQYGIGQVGGVAPRMIEANPMLRQVPFQAGRALQEEEQANPDRQARATGGRISGTIADRLLKAAEKAHKYHQKATEEILDAPDEVVVKALDVAKKHI